MQGIELIIRVIIIVMRSEYNITQFQASVLLSREALRLEIY